MMEIIRLLNRVIDLCAQGEYQGAETVAEYAKSEAESLIMSINALTLEVERLKSINSADARGE